MQRALRDGRHWRISFACGAWILFGTSWAVVARAQERNDAATPAPSSYRPERWMQRHQAFLERAKQGPIDVLFLGDSITEGWGRNPVWRQHFAPRHAANFGIGGDHTQHILWRLDHGEVDGISPKVVVLMIGTTNLASNTADEIAAAIKAIVQRLRDKLPQTKILLLAIFPRGEKPDPVREKLQAVNGQIAKLDDGKMIKYLDIGKFFLNDDGTISKEIMPDYLHLTLKGYGIWADAIEPTLRPMLGEGDAEKK